MDKLGTYGPPIGAPPPRATSPSPAFAPPPGPPPAGGQGQGTPATYAPPPGPPPATGTYVPDYTSAAPPTFIAPPSQPVPYSLPGRGRESVDVYAVPQTKSPQSNYAPPPPPPQSPQPATNYQPPLSGIAASYRLLRDAILANPVTQNEVASQSEVVRIIIANISSREADISRLTVQVTREARHLQKLQQPMSLAKLGAKMSGRYDQKVSNEALNVQRDEQALATLQQQLLELRHQAAQAEGQLNELRQRAQAADSNRVQLWRNVLEPHLRAVPSGLGFRDAILQNNVVATQAVADLVKHQQGLNLLTTAQRQIAACLASLSSALQSANTDLIFDNSFSEFNEMYASQDAQAQAQAAAQTIRAAQQLLPMIQSDLSGLNFFSISPFGTIIFDNLFSELRNIQYLQNTIARVSQAAAGVQTCVAHVTAQLPVLQSHIDNAENAAAQNRRNLVDVLVNDLEQQLGGATPSSRLFPDAMLRQMVFPSGR